VNTAPMTDHPAGAPRALACISTHEERSHRADAVGDRDVPLISVCMPVYNAERYAAEAVESILNQTFGDFEFLILDDGSTDGSLEILRRYADRDSRVKLTSRPNRGLVVSLNELVDQARGEFIARMDADDISLPERFQRELVYLRAHPECVVVGSRVRLIDSDGDSLCDWCTMQDHETIDSFFLQGKWGTWMSHPVVMMRHSALLAIGKYRNLSMMEDLDLFLRLAEHGRLTNLPEVLLKYRIHESNYSSDFLPQNEQAHRALWEMIHDARRRRNLPPVPTPPVPTTVVMTSAAAEREKWGWLALSSGQVQTARKYAIRALASTPFSLKAWRLAYCAIRGY
jgi:GT2 family glycosyltransferase